MNNYNFKPYDRVLVRYYETSKWSCDLYSFYDSDSNRHYCVGGRFECCIPYDGNEHLLGTTDSPQPRRWRAEENEPYYFINPLLQVDECRDLYYDDDDKCYEIGNYFRFKDEAETMAEKFKAMLKGG